MKNFTLRLSLLLLAGSLVQVRSTAAVVQANSQNNGSGGLCIGCSVSNAGNAADANQATYSTMNLTVGTLGSYVYQNLTFPSQAAAGSYVGLVLEDDNLGALDATVLGGLSLTTFNAGVSNGDSHSGSSVSINLLAGSTTKFYVEFYVNSPFDRVQVQMNAGILGALSKLRIYYAYYNATPLPVSLLYLKAQGGRDAVNLSWATATEINNEKFIVQRSSDGLNFEDIKELRGSVNSNKRIEYRFSDPEPHPGINYYRLKQVDFDGNTVLSAIVTGVISQDPLLEVFQVPGEAKRIAFRVGNVSVLDRVTVQLYEITTGRLICSGLTDREGVLDMEKQLASGIYAVRASVNDKVIKSQTISIY